MWPKTLANGLSVGSLGNLFSRFSCLVRLLAFSYPELTLVESGTLRAYAPFSSWSMGGVFWLRLPFAFTLVHLI
jgi:hypothetical protein